MTDKYVHYLESMKSLNRAWRVLKELQNVSDESEVWMAAYRMCLIDYCKPFKPSNGLIPPTRLKMEAPELPPGLTETHKYVINARDRILAHSDLVSLNPKVIYSELAESKSPMLVCTDVPNFPRIELMIELVESVIYFLKKLEPEYLPTRESP